MKYFLFIYKYIVINPVFTINHYYDSAVLGTIIKILRFTELKKKRDELQEKVNQAEAKIAENSEQNENTANVNAFLFLIRFHLL